MGMPRIINHSSAARRQAVPLGKKPVSAVGLCFGLFHAWDKYTGLLVADDKCVGVVGHSIVRAVGAGFNLSRVRFACALPTARVKLGLGVYR
jgi:hypothetical protein